MIKRKTPYFGRGTCPRCHFSARLTKDGCIGSHVVTLGIFERYCNGTGYRPAGYYKETGQTVADIAREVMYFR